MNYQNLIRINNTAANRYVSRGRGDDLARYAFPCGRFGNFLISGSYESVRLPVIGGVLRMSVGMLPIILLHNYCPGVERELEVALSEATQRGETPLYGIINDENPKLEPFFGMDEARVLNCLRLMVDKLGYTVNAAFERCARAHFGILKLLDAPLCLSSLYYLASIEDLDELYGNVIQLPCSRETAQRLWAELGASDSSFYEQFLLFRTVIRNFADEAALSGWRAGRGSTELNALTAAKASACLSLALDERHDDLMSIYLAEELKLIREPILLLTFGISIKSNLADVFRAQSGHLYWGICGDNVAELFPAQSDAFFSVSALADSVILLRHNSAQAAEKYSQLIGKYDETVAEYSTGRSREWLSFFPRGENEGSIYRKQSVFRVRPEEITSLSNDSAIVYIPSEGGNVLYIK